MPSHRVGTPTPEHTRAANTRWRTKYPDRAASANRNWRLDNPAKVLLNSARSSARERGWALTITVQDIEPLVESMTCALTGLTLRWQGLCRDPLAPSLDRIDSSQGYIPGNVRVVAWVINRMRGDLPDPEFLAFARLLVEKAAESKGA